MSDSSQQKIWIVCPYTLPVAGHMLNYIRSVVRGCAHAGIPVGVVGASSNPAGLDLGAPCRHVLHDVTRKTASWLPLGLRKLAGCIRSNLQFTLDARRLRDIVADPGNLIFVEHLDQPIALGVAIWVLTTGRRFRARLVLMSRSDCGAGRTKEWRRVSLPVRLALRLLARFPARQRLCVVTDSDRIAENHRCLWPAGLSVLPIPHTDGVAPDGADRPRTEHADGRIVLATLGSPDNPYKGFHLVAQAARKAWEAGLGDRMRFRLQVQGRSRDPVLLQAIETVRRLPGAFVEVFDRVLTEKEYFEFVESADVILLPYAADCYHRGTSGTFTEALAAGKPVVVTGDTWMSEQLGRHGAGVVFADGNAEDLLRAMKTVCDQYGELRRRAADAKGAWTAYHNCDNFVRELLRL